MEEASHAEGNLTTASGEASHAEGYITTASGEASHAEGKNTIAVGDSSHVEGFMDYEGEGYLFLTSTSYNNKIYKFNLSPENYIHIGTVVSVKPNGDWDSAVIKEINEGQLTITLDKTLGTL